VYTAEPGSESAEELGLLASWSVPTVSARPAPAVDET
jgi:isochorismate hydrolase